MLAGLAVVLSVALPSDLSAQDSTGVPTGTSRGDDSTGHGERGRAEPLLVPSSAEVHTSVKRISKQVMCACPDENWTRTLASCLDGCADPQKQEILQMVQAGSSDEAILTFMEQKYGSQVRSNPGWAGTGKWLYILPVAALIVGGLFAGYVILGWQKAGAEARSERRRLQTDLAPEEIARIESDLDSIE